MAAKKSKTKRRAAPSKRRAKAPTTGRRSDGRGKHGVTIRMYRLGVGDCFLLRFKRKRGKPFSMLIDCGVHQSQTGGAEMIREVVANIAAETGSKLDVLVVTHEHWDHLSGFSQARDLFEQFEIGEVWTPWTENSQDKLAGSLIEKRRRAIRIVGMASERLQAISGSSEATKLSGLQGFLGDTTGTKLAAAGAVIKALADDGKNVVYREPGERPFTLEGTNARVYVLGPPRSKELIKDSDPSKVGDEVYFGSFGLFLEEAEAAFCDDKAAPFARDLAIPLAVTESIGFFKERYWADKASHPPAEREDTSQAWRRIDTAWLDTSTHLALKLDEDTNNTSLVLAFELGVVGGPVLLFAADAQVGNWKSWQSVAWDDVAGKKVTAADLLRRTVVYKVGHHASHNATLKKEGLELMDSLELALVPTDAEMAKKVGWGTLPWPKLLKRLDQKTNARVIRTDEEHDGAAKGFKVVTDPLFYEVTL